MLNGIFLSAMATFVLASSFAHAIECKRKKTGYFQQMRAAKQAALVPRHIPGINKSLTGAPGDAERGRTIMLDESKGNCLMCHRIPELGQDSEKSTIGPNLGDVGARLSEAQLRQRIVNAKAVTPDTIMPAFHVTKSYARVSPAQVGVPVLTAQEVEDVVAFLKTLK
ncbi:MAG: sulfur oxidation c-type cytochrome SoxX [Alphaproteobacteria bacterium]